jgi:hypothetical protein
MLAVGFPFSDYCSMRFCQGDRKMRNFGPILVEAIAQNRIKISIQRSLNFPNSLLARNPFPMVRLS